MKSGGRGGADVPLWTCASKPKPRHTKGNKNIPLILSSSLVIRSVKPVECQTGPRPALYWMCQTFRRDLQERHDGAAALHLGEVGWRGRGFFNPVDAIKTVSMAIAEGWHGDGVVDLQIKHDNEPRLFLLPLPLLLLRPLINASRTRLGEHSSHPSAFLCAPP